MKSFVKNIMAIGGVVFLFFLLFLGKNSLVHAAAVEAPSFPSCPNPGGTSIASYSSGTHGVPGDATTYTGADNVFQITDTTVTQCLCPDAGSGVQTNWWNVTGVSATVISDLEKLGWVFIPDGSLWGLAKAPYLAFNLSFSCTSPTPTSAPSSSSGTSGSVGAPVCTATKPDAPTILSEVKTSPTTIKLTWTSVPNATYYSISYGPSSNNLPYGVPNTGNTTSFVIGALNPGVSYFFEVRAVNDCMPSDPSSISGGSVLGASTGTGGQVLGASTSVLADTSSDFIFLRGIAAISVFGLVFASGVEFLHGRQEN